MRYFNRNNSNPYRSSQRGLGGVGSTGREMLAFVFE